MLGPYDMYREFAISSITADLRIGGYEVLSLSSSGNLYGVHKDGQKMFAIEFMSFEEFIQSGPTTYQEDWNRTHDVLGQKVKLFTVGVKSDHEWCAIDEEFSESLGDFVQSKINLTRYSKKMRVQ